MAPVVGSADINGDYPDLSVIRKLLAQTGVALLDAESLRYSVSKMDSILQYDGTQSAVVQEVLVVSATKASVVAKSVGSVFPIVPVSGSSVVASPEDVVNITVEPIDFVGPETEEADWAFQLVLGLGIFQVPLDEIV